MNVFEGKNAGDKVTIQFNGKDVEATIVQPGVVQKTASIFYIQDSVTGEFLYCFPARLANLNSKYNGDLSQYKGRATRAAERANAKAAKAAEKVAKAAAKAQAEADAKAAAEANADATAEAIAS
jgi:hypothetical protein